MTYQIDNDNCLACGACELECPDSAISEDNGVYAIDASKCQGCGTCVDVCPVSAPQKVFASI